MVPLQVEKYQPSFLTIKYVDILATKLEAEISNPEIERVCFAPVAMVAVCMNACIDVCTFIERGKTHKVINALGWASSHVR